MAMPNEKYVSEKGELQWIFIDGEGVKDLNGNLKYKASVRFKVGSPEASATQAKIDAFWASNKPSGADEPKSTGFKEEVVKDKETGVKTKTGFMVLEMKTGVSFQDGKNKVIKIYNSLAKPVSLGTDKIGNGSVGHLSGAIAIYKQPASSGVTFYLDAVQVKKLVKYEGSVKLAEPEEEGWTGGDEDTGFTQEPTPETPATDKPKLKL